MRIKALALMAAMGLTTSAMADVVSVNVVGFVNMNLVNGWNLVVNPLSVTNPAVDTVGAIFSTLPDPTVILTWDALNQRYADSSTYSPSVYDPDVWENPNLAIPAGAAFFIKVPQNTTVTFVGEVRQGALVTPIVNSGYSMVGSQVPQGGTDQASGSITTALGFAPNPGDQILKWDAANQRYADANTYDPDIYDPPYWDIGQEPTLNIGEGMFVKRSRPGGQNWSRTFNVQ